MSHLPKAYQGFQHQFPEVIKAHDDLANKCHTWGPLDQKTRQLIKLGVAIGLNSEGGVRSHARQALEVGVTAGELRHTVLMALNTAGFPYMCAAMKWVEEAIEKQD